MAVRPMLCVIVIAYVSQHALHVAPTKWAISLCKVYDVVFTACCEVTVLANDGR